MACSVFRWGLKLWLTSFTCLWVYPHEYWIHAKPMKAVEETGVQLEIGCGHHFPKSVFALKDQVMTSQDVFLEGSDQTQKFVTKRDITIRKGQYTIVPRVPHLFQFELTRNGQSQPVFWGRCLVANDPFSRELLLQGHGLEIVPSLNLLDVKPTSEKTVQIFLDGQAVSAEATLTHPDGKEETFSVADDKTAVLNINQEGVYCLIVHAEGKGSSLVFHVGDPIQ